MNTMPFIFQNDIISSKSNTIIEYINRHEEDFGDVGSEYWKGRTIYYDKIRDANVKTILKLNNEYIIEKIMSYLETDKQIYSDSVIIVRWPETYSLTPHADSQQINGKPNEFPWRDFGVVTFLNDNFEGGILYYPNKNNLQVYPKTGQSVIHTGSLDCLHGVTKITKGVRYTIASFLTYDPNHEYKI